MKLSFYFELFMLVFKVWAGGSFRPSTEVDEFRMLSIQPKWHIKDDRPIKSTQTQLA